MKGLPAAQCSHFANGCWLTGKTWVLNLSRHGCYSILLCYCLYFQTDGISWLLKGNWNTYQYLVMGEYQYQSQFKVLILIIALNIRLQYVWRKKKASFQATLCAKMSPVWEFYEHNTDDQSTECKLKIQKVVCFRLSADLLSYIQSSDISYLMQFVWSSIVILKLFPEAMGASGKSKWVLHPHVYMLVTMLLAYVWNHKEKKTYTL